MTADRDMPSYCTCLWSTMGGAHDADCQARGTPPLDLQAVAARLEIYLEGGYLDERAEDVAALLAILRETRAALMYAQAIIQRDSEPHLDVFDGVLALARDEDATREANPEPE